MSMRQLTTMAALAGYALMSVSGALAQGRGGATPWVTGNADAQRTSWLRTDPQINKDSVQKGVMQFLWKLKMGNTNQQLNALTAPVFSGRIISYKGFKDPLYFAGSSDTVYAIDDPLGRLFWETKLPYQVTYPQQKTGSLECPGGLTSGVSMGLTVGPPPQPVAPPPAPVTPPPPAPAARGGNDPAGGRGRGGPAAAGRGPQTAPTPGVIYALTSDGLIHAINQHTGLDTVPGVKVVRGNANARGLIVVNNSGYVTTRNECGSAPNGVYSIDLAAPVKALAVTSWLTGEANVAGAAGVSFGTDRTVFAATGAGKYDPASNQYGGVMVSLQEKILKVRSTYRPADTSFTTTPVIFTFKGNQYAAAASQDGRIHVVEAATMVAAAVSAPISASKTAAPSALATFEEANGTRWILAPASGPGTGGSIVALKLTDQGGKLALEPAWSSRNIPSPSAPIIVNGVVFALATGEYVPPAGTALSAAQRAARSTPAVLYALDATTGKELWNSGRTITSFSRAPLAATASKIIVSTNDNTVYAFGYKMIME